MRNIILIATVLSLFSCGGSRHLPQVLMQTSYGEIVIEVDTANAPVTAQNFLTHVSAGSFEDAVFYRVVRLDNQPDNPVPIEVIQGGLYVEEKIAQYKGIFHETTNVTRLRHYDGTISMARNDPGTASTEFFICIGKQPELDFGGKRNPDGMGFAAFGSVIKGMDVVRHIQQLSDEGQYLNEPVKIAMSLKKE